MKTVLLGPRPAEVQALLDRRRALGQDTHDEVWNGTYVMAPAATFAHADLEAQLAIILGPLGKAEGLKVSSAFNLGGPDNFRVPDLGVHRGRPCGVWHDTAAIAVEVLSPDDATWDKLDHYAEHDVDELVIVDPDERRVHWLLLADGDYVASEHSSVLDVDVAEVIDAIEWPE